MNNTITSKPFLLQYAFFFALLFPLTAWSQATTPFLGCPDVYVVSYKNGTSCTVAPYNFYTMDINGNLSSSPFFSTANNIEINAFGINSADGFFYGMTCQRNALCLLVSNRFIRLDVNGLQDTLGVIRPPTGGLVSNALGVVSADNKYYFYANKGDDFYVGVINNISNLPRNLDTINASYKKLINNCPGKSFSDWAMKSDGYIYTYGIYNNSGVITGTVLRLSIATGVLECIASPNTTEFTDSRDNFGGIYFGADDNLYGINVFTRKYYRINIYTGDVTLINTLPGSGQLRGDMGSCSVGATILPVTISNFNLQNVSNCKIEAEWKTVVENDIDYYMIEKSTDGISYTLLQTVKSNNKNLQVYKAVFDANPAQAFYRLSVKTNDGRVTIIKTVKQQGSCYSKNDIKIQTTKTAEEVIIKIINNGLNLENGVFKLFDATGRVLHTAKLSNRPNQTTFTIHNLKPGSIYFGSLFYNDEVKTISFFN